MVSVSTVLLEIHWLTTPPLQPKSAVQASATPPRPKVEGPNAELSPVYPRKVEPVQPPPTQNNVQYNVGPAATGNTAARAETVQKPVAETTGVATRSESAAPPDNAQNAQAYAAPPKKNAPDEAAASNNRCDVQVCASAYKSFRASDCTYQPLDGRGACAARQRSSVPTANKETTRNVDPGAGAWIRARWIEEHGGGSMMRMKTTRTMRSFPAEAAAGRP